VFQHHHRERDVDGRGIDGRILEEAPMDGREHVAQRNVRIGLDPDVRVSAFRDGLLKLPLAVEPVAAPDIQDRQGLGPLGGQPVRIGEHHVAEDRPSPFARRVPPRVVCPLGVIVLSHRCVSGLTHEAPAHTGGRPKR
jgi:hypothetical protein